MPIRETRALSKLPTVVLLAAVSWCGLAGEATAAAVRADLQIACGPTPLVAEPEIDFWLVELTELGLQPPEATWWTGRSFERRLPANPDLCTRTPADVRIQIRKIPMGQYAIAVTGYGPGDVPGGPSHVPTTTTAVNFCFVALRARDTVCRLDHYVVAPLGVLGIAPPPPPDG